MLDKPIELALSVCLAIAMIACGIFAYQAHHAKAQIIDERQQNRALSASLAATAFQARQSAAAAESYRRQADNLSAKVASAADQAKSRSNNLSKALANDHNQTWRRAAVPDDISRVLNQKP